jgi:plasmid stabilization system protein ParE
LSRVVLTALARADLKAIGRHIARDNQVAAKRWVAKLRSTCKSTIGMFPECGTRCDELMEGMRCFSVDNYLIFFRGRDPVQIMRIVHGAMDVEQLRFVKS